MKKTIIFLLAFIAFILVIHHQDTQMKQKAEALLWAAYQGNLTEVKNALEEGAEKDWTLFIDDETKKYYHFQFTLLMAAASSGNEKLITHLINLGEEVNRSNEQFWTPLHIAIRDGHAESAARLARAEADPNLQTDTGATALLLATVSDFESEKQRAALIGYLLEKGANPNIPTHFGTDPLFYSVTKLKDKDIISLLLTHHADVCRVYEGKNILNWAAKDKKILPILQTPYEENCKTQN